ncbi:unnamed protein product [Pipistrellus nathusii]|uniref:Uncharacterized protein n=1 Tax=Pipistrellus nathusii TaxID=59473 RepID=A0ABN9ZF36_PIPNA
MLKQSSPLDLQPPRYLESVPPPDSLLDSWGTVCCHLPTLPTHGGIMGHGTTQPGPHLLDSVPTWASRPEWAGFPHILSAIDHIPRSLSSSHRLQGIGNCPSHREAANNVGVDSTEHPDDCLQK